MLHMQREVALQAMQKFRGKSALICTSATLAEVRLFEQK